MALEDFDSVRKLLETMTGRVEEQKKALEEREKKFAEEMAAKQKAFEEEMAKQRADLEAERKKLAAHWAFIKRANGQERPAPSPSSPAEDCSCDEESEEGDEKKKKKEEQQKLPAVVTLDVGGTRYRTTLATLTGVQDTMLAGMFSERFFVQQDADGAVFIDRDGSTFRYVLNFLRSQRLVLPADDEALVEMLEIEADYFRIEPLVEALKAAKRGMAAAKAARALQQAALAAKHDSSLLTDAYAVQLLAWIGRPDSKLRLLYRGSRDGFDAAAFHRLCDNKGATVTVVTSGGNLFGGYTPMCWTSAGQYFATTTNTEFLFSFRTPYSQQPQRFQVNAGNGNAIYCHPGYGPTFGSGHDLHIANGCNGNNSSYCNLPNSYQDPFGRGQSTFTGSRAFQVTEIEVLLVA